MKNAFISVCSLSLSRFVQSYSPGWSEHRSIAMPATLSRNIALVGRVHSCDDTLISPISRTRKNRSKSKKERKILSSTCSNDLSLRRIVEEEDLYYPDFLFDSIHDRRQGEENSEIEIQRRELLKLFSSSKLVVSIFLTACSFSFFFSKGESDLCVAKAGEVCLLQGRATSWTTGPRCLCIRTCALSPYVCSR